MNQYLKQVDMQSEPFYYIYYILINISFPMNISYLQGIYCQFQTLYMQLLYC